MRDQDQWLILDTETTGIRNPIYPVEIAAQIMNAWGPSGEPFRVLLNFDVPIDPIAEKLHGYSRDYLRQNGMKPEEALDLFFSYTKNLPIVAYNLIYDWNRVLVPTFQRMGVRSQLQPGFCALNLTRRVVPALSDFKLKTVIKTFGISKEQDHHADSDVGFVAQFMSQFIGPHLINSGVIGFDSVVACAEGKLAVPPLEPPMPVTKEKKKKGKEAISQEVIFSIGELVGICRAITMDNQLTDDELNFLASWLKRCPHSGVQPIAGIFDMMTEILADGQITAEEQQRIAKAIEDLMAWRP